jgi:hypothetical protein
MSDELSLDQITVAQRAANEGIPVAAISRIVARPFKSVLDTLKDALELGKIGQIPKADWPPAAKRDTRCPTVPRSYNVEDMEFHCRKVFKLTLLEAGFMTVLLRYECADKERLHGVVESQRMKRQQRPNQMHVTDMKIVDVIVCKMRKKLKDKDPTIKLDTSWGRGYFFEPAVKAKIFDMIGGTYGCGPEAGRGDDCPDADE